MKKMKTRKKMIAMVEIAIVLCSVFLVALPAITADQNTQKISASTITTASEDDYVLGIYGNANEDDIIDMRDLTYVKLIFFGKKSETELADAKYDGKINPLDFIQIKLIIVGKEKELTLVDSLDRIVTVKKPVKRAVLGMRNFLELLRTIQVKKDQIVGISVGSRPDYNELFLSEYIDLPIVGSSTWNLDLEAILNLYPDAVFIHRDPQLDATNEVLESAGVPVLRFYGGTYLKDIEKEMKTVGYIFDKEEEAEEFIDWYENLINSIKGRVDGIPEEDRPKVYYESSHKHYYGLNENMAHVEITGGKNIFPDGLDIDPEAVVAQDPDIIVIAAGCSGGYFLDADDTAELKEIRDEMMNRPELQSVAAVKNERVYVINGYMLSGFGCSSGRGFLQIPYNAKWFHPELFEDLDPKAIHQEYLTKFRGLGIDLDKKGVFVYHPELHPHGS
jgi:iron complex transport system substrate-binding protein